MTAIKLLPAFTGAPERNRVYNVSALTLLRALPDASVDAIVTDLPYGTTACSWDTIIPFEPMWREVKRTLKPRGVFVTTASQPFTSKLVMSNIEMFKYSWVWVKEVGTNFLNSSREPMKEHEDVLVFGFAETAYYPQYIQRKDKERAKYPYKPNFNNGGKVYGNYDFPARMSKDLELRIPSSVLCHNREMGLHPTQKPVALYEYLINTYTQPGDLVVDFCAGSGTTAVAARNTKRDYIIGDTDAHYCDVARERLRTSILEPRYVKCDEDVTAMPTKEGYKSHLFAAAVSE